MQQTPTGILSLLEERVFLPASTEELAASYRTAEPFPHLIIDNMFPEHILDEVLEEIPGLEEDRWIHDKDARQVKSNLRSATELGEAGFQFSSLLHSAKFLYLLSELTGIWGLLPDPYLGGGGYHVVPSGGHFDVHADRNVDPMTGLRRRLAMLIYLNKSWKSEYGGQLELWDKTAKRCEKVIEPVYNRVVIFEVGDLNYHGVKPVLSDTRTRKSFAVYYHTVGDKDLRPHTSIYTPVFYQAKEPIYKRVLRDATPPGVLRGIRRLLGRR
jgi:2OG-Fe(II) oxygenase superfamily